jgi:hypothetical protein
MNGFAGVEHLLQFTLRVPKRETGPGILFL